MEKIKYREKLKKAKLLYGTYEQEFLDNSIEEAIERIKNQRNKIKWPIEVLEYTPREFNLSADNIIEEILKGLDDCYGDPYATTPTSPTNAMKKATENLVDIIKRDYKVWTCRSTGKVYLVYENGEIKEKE